MLGADAAYYSGGANLLAGGSGFIEPGFALAFGHVQSASHPPVYTLWLTIAAFFSDGHHGTQATFLIWSCVLGSGTVVLCGLAGREAVGPRCGIVVAALAAVYPNLWVHDGMLFSETAAILVAAGVILLAYRFWNRPGILRALLLGGWCGFAALACSELVLTWPLVCLPLIVCARRRRPATTGASGGRVGMCCRRGSCRRGSSST